MEGNRYRHTVASSQLLGHSPRDCAARLVRMCAGEGTTTGIAPCSCSRLAARAFGRSRRPPRTICACLGRRLADARFTGAKRERRRPAGRISRACPPARHLTSGRAVGDSACSLGSDPRFAGASFQAVPLRYGRATLARPPLGRRVGAFIAVGPRAERRRRHVSLGVARGIGRRGCVRSRARYP